MKVMHFTCFPYSREETQSEPKGAYNTFQAININITVSPGSLNLQ